MTTSYQKLKHRSLKNPAVCAEYEALGPEYEVVRSIIKHRLKRGWSQTDLAKAIGSRQPVISRLERGEGNPSLSTLQKIASALEVTLSVSLR